jgi:hypothetical protein
MRAAASADDRNGVVLGSCVGLAMLLLVLVSVLVPEDVIAQYRFLQDCIAVTSMVIPGVERLAAVSSFPEVTRLVVSLMWMLVPVFTAFYVLKMEVPERYFERFRESTFFLTFATVIVALLLVLGAVLYDITPDDLVGGMLNETVLRTVSTSRIGLGLIAGFFAGGFAGMLYCVLIWAFNLRRIYFPKRGDTTL